MTIDRSKLDRDVRDTNRRLARYAQFSGRGIAVEVRNSARRLSANFAYRTQPFGNSEAAHNQGMVAVQRDVYRVFATPGMLYDEVKARAGANSPILDYFWRSAKAGNARAVRKILKDLGIDMPVAQTPKRALHKSARNSRGRVSSTQRPAQLVLGGKGGDSLKRYVSKIQKRVGWAASGWSACAAQLGSTRGIVKWKKRGKRGPGYVLSTGGTRRPTHYLVNTASYASAVLPVGEQRKAVRREERTLRQQTEIALRKSAKKARLRVS
ncbi:hypothetical protein QEH52_01750 [Coraliomargarita sp. SDUM461003]|uniref:Uncharacterized protein n=1 Tax=Thalassobacterium maritimum TaxID=3041265 RepID=A0ABU1APW4_9BACT|nr:hypothetical protein [Coraliomargarita sp. SDUM461003]MDQ8206216.1 hypothetical protein [Coraliomargarita sp. SDUM461003]